MFDTVRKFVEAGFEKLSSKRAEELAKALVKQGQATGQQATRLARELRDWSKRNSERLVEVARREARQQVARMKVADKDEVAALRKRVRELEEELKKRTSPRKSTAKRSTAKTSTSRKSTAKKSTSRKSPAKKSSATGNSSTGQSG